MIFPSGLDLCDLATCNDFAGSMQDVAAWEAVMAECVAKAAADQSPVNPVNPVNPDLL